MKNKALVTGGAGFIGHHLVKSLVSSGSTVYLVDDLSASVIDVENYFKENNITVRSILPQMLEHYNVDNDTRNPSVVFINSDFSHPSILQLIESKQIKTVFHLAAKPRVEWSVENPIKSTEENFTKSIDLARSCALGDSRIVFSSTAAVYGDVENLPTEEGTAKNPESPYGLAKLCVEKYMALFEKLYSLDWVALRYFNVYGPAQPGDSPYSTVVSAWCHKVCMDEPLRSDGDGEQTRDMIYVDDVVTANMCVANAKTFTTRIFNVGSSKAVSNNYIRSLFVKKGYDKVNNAPARKGDVRHTLADTTNLRALGWQPDVDFDLGMEKVFKYWEL